MSHHEEIPVDEQAQVQADGTLAAEQSALLYSITSQTPWWVVSVIFHGLVIALVGLVSMTINIGDGEVMIPVTTPVFLMRENKSVVETPKEKKPGDALVDQKFNPDLPEQNIYVSEEFRRIAEEGPTFEMVTKDPFEELGIGGNPDARAILFSSDPTDKQGGSGGGGKATMEDLAIGAGEPNKGSGGGRHWGDGLGEGFGQGDGKGIWGKRNAGGRKNSYIKYNPRSAGNVPFDEFDRQLKEALRWLAYHQEPDGHWDTKKYGAEHKCDVAMTGMALLAFLGYGHTEKVGEHRDNVKRAVAWLIAHQKDDGLIVDENDDGATHRRGGYPMAIASLAMAEAAGMANIPATRAAAQKAINYCVNVHQCGDGSEKMGWRYAPKTEGDLSVTGWFIMALKSAKVSRLNVDSAAFDGAQRFLESVEIKDKSLDTGYGPVSHFKYMPNAEHASTAHRLTAIGTLARLFMGWKPEELQGSVEWFLNKGGMPAWGGNGEKVDLYYWYYASMTVFQQDEKLFGTFAKAMYDALLPNQRQQGDEKGSWDPVGDYSGEWGRVGQTALSALCLEVCFRNDKVNKR